MKNFHTLLTKLSMGAGFLLAGCLCSHAQGQQTLESKALTILETHCFACHGPDEQESDIRFDVLETVDTVDLQTLFTDAQDAVHFAEMPPEDAKSQPTDAEREILLEWFKGKLTGDAAGKLEEKMRRPGSGNYTDHEELFSGKHADKPGYTYGRRWLISEYIFNEKFNRILSRSGSRKIGSKKPIPVQGVSKGYYRSEANLTNPFLLPTHAGVRYYANEPLTGGHLLTMMGNARSASAAVLEKVQHNDRYTHLPMAKEILAQEADNTQTLERRREFLELNIIHLLEDIFKDQHNRMNPQFVPSENPPRKGDKDSGKNNHAINIKNPGKEEVQIIQNSIYRNEDKISNKEELYETIEREWFNYGYSDRDIAIRITFLNEYWDAFMAVPGYFLKVERHVDQVRQRIKFKPLKDEDEMQIITAAIRKHRKPGDRYLEVVDKCMAEWEADFERDRIAAGPPSEEQLDQLIRELVEFILEREPRSEEFMRYRELAYQYAEEIGRHQMIRNLIQTVMLSTDFVTRLEFGVGAADEHGRRMLSPRAASYALAYALTDSSPDEELVMAAEEGRLNTRADYEREVRRMLARRDLITIVDEKVDGTDFPSFTRMPIRELRFFREFFGYDKVLSIFKDAKRFGARDYGTWEQKRIIVEADLLVEHIVESDQKVFEKLLTTDEFYVFHNGDNEEMQAGSARLKKCYNYFKDKDWKNFTIEDLRKHKAFFEETPIGAISMDHWSKARHRSRPLATFKRLMEDLEMRVGDKQLTPAPYKSGAGNRYGGRMLRPAIARMFNIDMTNWDYPTQQPAKIENRKGILTHPAWLISFAANFETDPIHRGIWVQEKLLAGTIPDVPITVDAVIPPDPDKTFRQRLDAKTNNNYCMRCHTKINPLGIPFEMYDDFGRFRTVEALEYPEKLIEEVPAGINPNKLPHIDTRDIYVTRPVEADGYLKGTGDSSLDGEVKDALDLIDRLGRSDRARQSIIRHAFRYFMGRNETLSDSKTLIDADQAYLKSGGSFDEVIVSLLTSDSFIYRKKLTTNK